MSVTAEEFRHALGHSAAGVSVLTTGSATGPRGMTVTSFTSLSLHPPLVLACIDHRVTMHALLPTGQPFAVNMLAHDQEPLSRRFSNKREVDPFASCAHKLGPLDTPVLEGALSVVGCRVVERHAGGDHTIVIGEVLWTEIGAGAPLLHWRGKYAHLKPA